MKSHLNGFLLHDETASIEGAAYGLSTTLEQGTFQLMTAELPTAEYVEFLLNSVQFHLGSVLCLFDKASFLGNLRQHYESHPQQSNDEISTYQGLWIVQARLIVAFGQLVTGRQATEFGPPGAEYFVQAV